MAKKKNKKTGIFDNKVLTVVIAAIILIALFAVSFAVTTAIIKAPKSEPGSSGTGSGQVFAEDDPTENNSNAQTSSGGALTTEPETTVTPVTTEKQSTTAAPPTTSSSDTQLPSAGTIPYPTDTASWQLICLNRNRCVDSSYENSLSLKYVAGSGEQMDSRAAAAYEKMYSAAASDGIYLTPCSGYRSYSTQKRLFNEFYNEYLAQGYSAQEAYDRTSTRRNPPGSSEHNIGICMDIICAASSANFENTRAYAWLMNNAADYGFILRYPADKTDITGVKFEPWHWRYVGTENAYAIKASGLCLEEYLGLA